MQGTTRVRGPGVTLELCCVHTGLILAKEEQISQVHSYSFLCRAREEGGEQRMELGGQETNLPRLPLRSLAAVSSPCCFPAILPFPQAINK